MPLENYPLSRLDNQKTHEGLLTFLQLVKAMAETGATVLIMTGSEKKFMAGLNMYIPGLNSSGISTGDLVQWTEQIILQVKADKAESLSILKKANLEADQNITARREENLAKLRESKQVLAQKYGLNQFQIESIYS